MSTSRSSSCRFSISSVTGGSLDDMSNNYFENAWMFTPDCREGTSVTAYSVYGSRVTAERRRWSGALRRSKQCISGRGLVVEAGGRGAQSRRASVKSMAVACRSPSSRTGSPSAACPTRFSLGAPRHFRPAPGHCSLGGARSLGRWQPPTGRLQPQAAFSMSRRQLGLRASAEL